MAGAKQLFGNPWVGAVGTVASIMSLVVAFYFWEESKRERDLTYHVHPARTAIVNEGAASNISVDFEGKSLKSSVSALSIAFWNDGAEPIRASDVLAPIQIALAESTPILEAKVLKTSREPVSIHLSLQERDLGVVGIEFNIFERHDGGVVQIIYAGDDKVGVSFSGVIVGQSSISTLSYPGEIKSPTEQYDEYRTNKRNSAYVYIGTGLVLLFVVIVFFLKRGTPRGLTELILVSQPLLFIGMGVYELIVDDIPIPPFGF